LCLCDLGWASWELGARAEARAAAEEGLALAKNEDWALGIMLLQSLLGVLCSDDGDLEAARSLLNAGLEIQQRGWYLGGFGAQNVIYIGWIFLQQGERDKARALFGESVLFHHDMGDQAWLAESLEGCACVEVAAQRP